ncbi:hypothetical protein BDF19DRAFT_428677 [Syncephalis fuscata]|nr:hypothetical protein BDF19DRAFT_428677 [Syncephalis fuscata]
MFVRKRTMNDMDCMDIDPVENVPLPLYKSQRGYVNTSLNATAQQSEAYTWMKLRAGQQHVTHTHTNSQHSLYHRSINSMSIENKSQQECKQSKNICPSANSTNRFTDQKCTFCEQPFCTACLVVCFVCQQSFCSICSTINYDAAHERFICLSCLEQQR